MNIVQRTLIIGAGAVGLGLAGFLSRAGQRVTVLARNSSATRLRDGGLKTTGVLGSFQSQLDHLTDLQRWSGDPAAIFVCVKSFDSLQSAQQLANVPAIAMSRCPIILCQNGWGNAETFSTRFPRRRIFNACLFTGFELLAPNHVNITAHARPIRIGNLWTQSAPSEPIAASLTTGGISCEASNEISRDLWDKMCFNCVVNGLAAIYDLNLGELAESPSLRLIIRRIIDETFAVMAAHGFTASTPKAGRYLDRLFGTLLKVTADHRPSMWQDLQRGRRTEIDALNGVLVRLADLANIDAQTNCWLCQKVKLLTRNPQN